MELSHKINKLRTGEAWHSLLDAYYRWRRPLNAAEMVHELESKGFERIRSKYANPDDKKGWPKYVDAGHRLELAIQQARSVQLDRRKPFVFWISGAVPAISSLFASNWDTRSWVLIWTGRPCTQRCSR